MCYEFSPWFQKARATDQARQQQLKSEQVTQPREPAPKPQPVAPQKVVGERETTPA